MTSSLFHHRPLLLLIVLCLIFTTLTSCNDKLQSSPTTGVDQADDNGFTFDVIPDEAGSSKRGKHYTGHLKRNHQPVISDHIEASIGMLFEWHVKSSLSWEIRNNLIAIVGDHEPLPSWIYFRRGHFLGVPSHEDAGRQYLITILSLPDGLKTVVLAKITLTVRSAPDSIPVRRCGLGKDETVLVISVDKPYYEINAKQKVKAIIKLAKFFNVTSNSIILLPSDRDIIDTDSVIIFRGTPDGVIKTHPKTPSPRTPQTSAFKLVLGCDRLLWKKSVPLVRNLNDQVHNGTIAKLLDLPLINWELVQQRSQRYIRKKRETIDDYDGSGDYDEDYYNNYYDDDLDGGEDEEDDLGEIEGDRSIPTLSKRPISVTPAKTTTTTSTSPSSTTHHPHRHHHGEQISIDEEEGDDDEEEEDEELELEDNQRGIVKNQDQGAELPIVPITSTTTTSKDLGPTKINLLYKKKNNTSTEAVNPADYYDYGNYDDNEEDDDDDPVESETIIPAELTTEKTTTTTTTATAVPAKSTPVVTETVAVSKVHIPQETVNEVLPDNSVVFNATTSRTTESLPTTIKEIVEDTEPPSVVIAETATTVAVVTEENESVTSPVATTYTTSSMTTTTTSSTTPLVVTSTATSEEETAATIQQVPSSPDADTTTALVTDSTTVKLTSTTSRASPTTPLVRIPTPPPRNFKPYIEKRLQYKSVTAGKVFRFVIPTDTFKDSEDGYNLTLQVLDSNEHPISVNKNSKSWLHFNPLRRELYGLPLTEDVHNWIYFVRAIDKDGNFEQDELTIQVQQHPMEQVYNHEFFLTLRIEKPQEYPHYIDWSLKVLRTLGKIYNTNMSEITVRRISYEADLVVFAWSNDSLPTNFCPRNEIEDLYKILTANDQGDPDRELVQMLLPSGLRVKRVNVEYHHSICPDPRPPPVQPPFAVTPSSTNFSPILRNPVDMVDATLGELLIYKVKDDTFYDPEDVDPSMLNITLLTDNLKKIPSDNWLQFDNKNREFFGIPQKTGRTQYWLVCVDSGGMSAKDSLEVWVKAAEKVHYNVEFSMTLEVAHMTFSESAGMQRKFVERLMDIFDEPNSNNFHFVSFESGEPELPTTIVRWFNKSLPTDHCPTDEIKRIENLLHNSETRSISARVHRIMAPDFTVSTIKVHHIGNCKPKHTHSHDTDDIVTEPPPQIPTAVDKRDYLMTFIIPAALICLMVFIASLAACILYRSRRRRMMGKMNVADDNVDIRRHAYYGNKGIPVIFQEELDEKPESGTKTPIILKDERPPLAAPPPDYSSNKIGGGGGGGVGNISPYNKLDDAELPYQPPPPPSFTRNNNQDNNGGVGGGGRANSRPKQTTPIYRKPPPYVPP